jgi:hypothetical protein
MDIPQLMEIASDLGIKVTPKDELETVIYAILDKAAEDSAANERCYQAQAHTYCQERYK